MADTEIDCGADTDVAILDASDPTTIDCETSDRGTATTPPPTGTTNPDPGTSAGAGTGTGTSSANAVAVLATGDTTEKTKMPDVVGKEVDAARAAVLAKVAGVDLDVVFQKGCGQQPTSRCCASARPRARR